MEHSNEPSKEPSKELVSNQAEASEQQILNQDDADDRYADHEKTEAAIALVQLKLSSQASPAAVESILRDYIENPRSTIYNHWNFHSHANINNFTVNRDATTSISHANTQQSTATNLQEIPSSSSSHSTEPPPSPELPSAPEEGKMNITGITANDPEPLPSAEPTTQPRGLTQNGTARRTKVRAPVKTTQQSQDRYERIRKNGTLNRNGRCEPCARANQPCYTIEGGLLCDWCTKLKGSGINCNILSEEQKAAKRAGSDRRTAGRKEARRAASVASAASVTVASTASAAVNTTTAAAAAPAATPALAAPAQNLSASGTIQTARGRQSQRPGYKDGGDDLTR